MATSRTLGYIDEMEKIVASIVIVLGEKYAVIVLRPTGEIDPEGQPVTEPVNIAREELENYYIGIWQPEIGISSTGCWVSIEDYCSNKMADITQDTIRAISAGVLISEDVIESGITTKAEAMGELCDSDGIKKARDLVKRVLNEDDGYSSPTLSNMEIIGEIIEKLNNVRSYIRNVVANAKGILGELSTLDGLHTKISGAYADLVLFAGRGDYVTHTYYSRPKSRTAIQSFNNYIYNIMSSIEGTVPGIIDYQYEILNVWGMINEIDKSEFVENKYLDKAYEELEALKEECQKQYLSGEIEEIGSKTSAIAFHIGCALSDSKSNETYDKLSEIQQRLQLAALDGLTPMNVIERSLNGGWGSEYKPTYEAAVRSARAKLEHYKQDV